MPRQRGHPHHHGAAERRERGRGLQLPDQPPFRPWAPFRYGARTYPMGCISRPWWRGSVTTRVFVGLWTFAVLIALVLTILSRL